MNYFTRSIKRATLALASLALGAVLTACGGGGAAPASTQVAKNAPVASDLQKSASAPRDTRRAAADTFTGQGWYWDPAAGGTGLMVEAQGDAAFLGLFMYDDMGVPVWYVGEGAFELEPGGWKFVGVMKRFSNGQGLSGGYRTPTGALVGDLVIHFTGTGTATRAAVSLPGGRTWNVQRFNFGGVSGVNSIGGLGWGPAPNQPEVGWFWNKDEGGRGYALEVQGTRIFVAMFHYTGSGAPVWHIIEGDITSGVLQNAAFTRYSGGQSLTSGYRPATGAQEGVASISFSRACDGNIMLPGAAQWLGIERFRFGVNQPCKNSLAGNLFGGDLVTSVAEASYPFLSDDRKAWNVLNGERARCGFGMVRQYPLLDVAARNHRDYMIANPGLEFAGHTEIPGRVGYTGVSPQDRTTAVGYSGQTSESVLGLAGFNSELQGSTRIRGLMSLPYHGLDLITGRRDVGFGQGGGTFVASTGLANGEALQSAPGVRTWPCQGSVEAAFAGAGEIPSPFPNEANANWGTPILVVGDSGLRIATASITGPSGAVPLKAIYGDGQTSDPQGRCVGTKACVIPVMLEKKTVYEVKLTGTNGGQPLHPSGTLTFSFMTSGMLN